MTMTILWTGMVVLSILCGLATGQSDRQVAAAAVEGTPGGGGAVPVHGGDAVPVDWG